MKPLGIERAENLDSMLRAFMTEPLDENTLPTFYYDKTMAIRTGDEWDSPLLDLYDACTTPKDNNAHLLLGHSGCGKSTELNNLRQNFEKLNQPVWKVDCMLETDFNQVDHWDIMLLITVGLCHIADNKNVKIPNETLKAIFDLLENDIESIEKVDDSSSIGVSAGAEVKTPLLLSGIVKLFAGITSDFKASQSRSITIKKRIERRASDWINYTKEISNRITSDCGGKQPILIFEDLDKLPRPEKSFAIFRYSVLAQMPFPIIYTFPISQSYSSEFATIRGLYTHHILPMIKVSNIDRSKNTDGFDVIRKIVKLRAELQLFDDDALNLLIAKTGGSLRDLFKCIISAATRASRRGASRIETEDAERALSNLVYELTSRISQKDYPMLEKIYCDRRFREQVPDEGFLVEKMRSLVVLEYRNTIRWHDVHPLIAKFLIEQGVICETD